MPEGRAVPRLTGPLLVLLAGALLFFWPLWTGRSHLVPFHVLAGDPALEGLDLAADRPDWRLFDLSPITVFYAEKAQAARQIRSGELPLWNPCNGLGVPLLADAQCQPFAPLFLPFLLFTNPWAYSVCLVLHLFFGGVGTALFLRRLKCGAIASSCGTALFAFNPFFLNYLVYSDAWAYVWYPWLFLAADESAERPRRWWLLAAAAAGAGASGHIEAAFIGAASASAYLVIRLAPGGRWGRTLAVGVSLPVLAAALSAWWVLPFLEWVAHSTSPRFGGGFLFPYHPSACFIAGSELLVPAALVALVVLGAASKSLSGRRWGLLPGFLWGLAMMFPWPAWLQRGATFDFMSGRYGRSIFWFVVAAGAAAGLQAFVEKETPNWLRWTAAAAGLAWLATGHLVEVPSLSSATANHWVPLSGEVVPAFGWLGASSLLCLVLIALPERWLSRTVTACGLGGLAVVMAASQQGALDLCWNRSEPKLNGEVLRAAEAEPGRLWFPERDLWRALPPNLSALFGVRDVRYCSPLFPSRLAMLNRDPHPNKDLFQGWDVLTMKFLGVNTAFTTGLEGPLTAATSTPVLGRARWISRADRSSDALQAAKSALKDGAWAQTVYLEGKAAGAEGKASPRPAGSVVRAIRDDAARSEWSVSAPAEGWLLLRDLYWPGWKATVDGRPAPVLAADGVFLAVPVGAGTHVVAFRYRPSSFLWGLALSSFAVLAFGVVALLRRRGARGGGP